MGFHSIWQLVAEQRIGLGDLQESGPLLNAFEAN